MKGIGRGGKSRKEYGRIWGSLGQVQWLAGWTWRRKQQLEHWNSTPGTCSSSEGVW
jgi:hypothetical protein